jgi:hypothetical protein
MKRSRLLLLVLAFALAGCAGAPRAPQPSVLSSGTDYELLWKATVDVVGARFRISSAEKDRGVVETAYLVGALSMTGAKSNAVSTDAVNAELLHTIRRKAVVNVPRTGGEALRVRVDAARFIRERGEVIRGGMFWAWEGSGDELDRYPSRWFELGRDEELEAVIIAEIEKRYAALARAKGRS